MSKEIDDSFDKAEKIVERGGKLIIKVFTAVIAVILGITFAISQLDGDFGWGKKEETPKDSIKGKDTIVIVEKIIDTVVIKNDIKDTTVKKVVIVESDTIKKDTIK